MPRHKGSKNIKYILDPVVKKDKPVTKKDIQKKMSILFDFGFTKTEAASFFTEKQFRSLRELDMFTDSIIKKILNGELLPLA